MSKALTKQQIEHLDTRINSAILGAKNAFQEKLPKVEFLNPKQRVAAAKKGQFTFRFDSDGNIPYYTNAAIEFDHDKKMNDLKEDNEKVVERFSTPLYAEKQRIMDKAILGGAEEALAAMTAFIAKLNK